jgi:hypothetical protein
MFFPGSIIICFICILYTFLAYSLTLPRNFFWRTANLELVFITVGNVYIPSYNNTWYFDRKIDLLPVHLLAILFLFCLTNIFLNFEVEQKRKTDERCGDPHHIANKGIWISRVLWTELLWIVFLWFNIVCIRRYKYLPEYWIWKLKVENTVRIHTISSSLSLMAPKLLKALFMR